MAGPYVHCLVVREALKSLYADAFLARYQDFTNPDEASPFFPYVCLGSVSPDFPYPALHLGFNSAPDANGWTWGDKFHKENTGTFIDIGIRQLQGMEDKGSDAFLKRTAWLMGYLSHIITDLVIHAVVYEIVGGCYENHRRDHLHCEVVQDALLFLDVYCDPARELIESEFFKTILEKCRTESVPRTIPTDLPTYVFDPDIETFWDSILRQNYPEFYDIEAPEIDTWYEEYSDLMRIATKVPARTIEPGIAYHKTTDIPDSDKAKYYFSIALPDGTSGDYRNRVFAKAVGAVAETLKTYLLSLDNSASYALFKNELGPWNIDKGTVSISSPQFALWNGQTEFPFDCHGDPPVPRS
jgi:hypothetical protein